MKKTIFALALATSSLILHNPVFATTPVAQVSPDPQLASLIERYSAWVMENEPYARMNAGQNIKALPNIAPETIEKDAAYARRLKAELVRIPAMKLLMDDQISHAILTLMLDRQIAAPQINACSFGVTPYDNVLQSAQDGLDGFAIKTAADADLYVKLVAGLPAYIKQMQAHLAGNAARGMSLPKAYLGFIAPQFSGIAKDEAASPFALNPERLTKLSKAKADATINAVNLLITAEVNPVLNALSVYISGPYAAKASDAIGMGQTPACADAYKQQVRFETTTDMTPDAIHALGLKQVAALKAEMAAIRKEIGITGTSAAFWASLQSKPELKAKSKTEIAANMQRYTDFIESHLPQSFADNVIAKGVARPISEDREAGETFGYYALPTATEANGVYWFNGANELKGITITHEGLIAHELYPGHHYQSMRVVENSALSVFRKNYTPSAYLEGWAEYAGRVVAKDLGAFTNPYSRYGSLSDELFLATRLVVDTGMNAKGWSLAKARAYMKENTFKTDEQIATESLRYGAGIPAQALGYRIGYITILKLRQNLAAEMGAQFDIKRFHNAMLNHGALPMFMLEKVARYELSKALQK
jgi:uncharacterized protein (DUF885 family)